ncbi:MAG TPA: ATP-binding cassette domain-containing protein [Acholeplasmataceae bacterium]|nr:ATP-binding cassette domain-containing protein [Acholeplasmataceae bacterium]
MLKVKSLTKIFNKDLNPEDLKVALDNISLEINEGEFVTVIGGNGSGKTTLLNVISGTVTPDEGQVFIDQEDVTNLKDYKRSKYIGIVFQDPLSGTAANMSLEENLALATRRAKKKGLKWGFNKNLSELFKEKLATLNLGLETRLNNKIGLLSGGQRQAVTLLMATLDKPKLLLLDEHTAALDPKTAKIVLELTNKIVTENKLTTLMITHNMRDALKYGNRLLMLNNGRIVLDVSGEEKQKLTLEDLLKKFGALDDLELTDKMLLS